MDGTILLKGARVTLAPLGREHRDALLAAAADGELWTLRVTNVPGPATVDAYIDTAIRGREEGSVIPFVTMVGDRVIGSTRFWKLDRTHRQAEIGHTWIAASWQRSFVNTEAKLLMLRHAFEELGLIRVQFTTDELNAKSRAAILRLGAVEEGLIRNERIMPDGRIRNSIRFSIIDSEWRGVKAGLERRLAGEG
ncbi:GNAT family N-acetyltransferase [Sphingobium sufflavum]|uniref:GNAT family N-acetyltransferase n=1 Tax=Sphingobium sufflavum TaxID=1129547 RepID=UPI001F3F5D67|nr:GNAT family protein [Sphingobium sufflavum]MCE7795332.1 GNAT family N-acetyltransferase [Sphingobium sufflavum]